MAAMKKLVKIRAGQVAASRSRIFGDEDGLPFWVDDRVRRNDPGEINPRLGPLPGYPPDVRLVREIIPCGEGHEYLLSDHLCGGWQEAAKAEGLEMVERGNVWRLLNGEATIFRDWREELDCRRLIGQVAAVWHPGGRTIRWLADEARGFIERGAADAYALFCPDRPPARGVDIRLYRFEDRQAADRVRPEALKAFGAFFALKA